jgi:hypothetical protein
MPGDERCNSVPAAFSPSARWLARWKPCQRPRAGLFAATVASQFSVSVPASESGGLSSRSRNAPVSNEAR